MNPTLITTIARQEVAERIEAAQRERLVAQSSTRRGPRAGRLASAARRLLASMAAWRTRTQLGAVARPQADPRLDSHAP